MTLWSNILTLLILFGLFILIYSKIRNKNLIEIFEEIFELLKFDGVKK